MLSDVESDVYTEFDSHFFFNEWLEKYGIIRNKFQEPNCTNSLRNFTVTGFFKCSNFFDCSTWGSPKYDKVSR